MRVDQFSLFHCGLVVNVSQVLVVIVNAQFAVDRPSVDLIGLFVNGRSEMFGHVMTPHKVRQHVGPFVQLIDAVNIARRLRDHQIALVVRFDEDVDEQKVEKHKTEQRTAGQVLAVLV